MTNYNCFILYSIIPTFFGRKFFFQVNETRFLGQNKSCHLFREQKFKTTSKKKHPIKCYDPMKYEKKKTSVTVDLPFNILILCCDLI